MNFKKPLMKYVMPVVPFAIFSRRTVFYWANNGTMVGYAARVFTNVISTGIVGSMLLNLAYNEFEPYINKLLTPEERDISCLEYVVKEYNGYVGNNVSVISLEEFKNYELKATFEKNN